MVDYILVDLQVFCSTFSKVFRMDVHPYLIIKNENTIVKILNVI